MKVDIQSIHFKADVKLLDFITRKVEKVQTFSDGIKSADVYLKVEKDAEKENKTVEVKINVSGNPIFAREQSNTFESATDMVLDKLVTQVKKHKQRVTAA
jgi:putative sigma-54 modulation protein